MTIESRRSANGLRSIIDEDIQSLILLLDIVAENLYTRYMPKIQSMYFQPMPPICEILFLRKSKGRVYGKASSGYNRSATSQEKQTDMIAYFQARARHHCYLTGHICQLKSLGIVEITAVRAHGVIEVMHGRIFRLTDIAKLRLGQFSLTFLGEFLRA
jgi:hypothetical protein